MSSTFNSKIAGYFANHPEALVTAVVGLGLLWNERNGRQEIKEDLKNSVRTAGAAAEGIKEDFAKVGAEMKELKKDIKRIQDKINVTNNNVLLFGQTILQAQNGDKTQLRKALKLMGEACKGSGGC